MFYNSTGEHAQGVKFLFFPIFSYFFLFFGPVPIFSCFYKKTSYFYYFLTVGAMQLAHLASIFSLFIVCSFKLDLYLL